MEQIWLSLTLSNFISQGLSSLDPTKRWSQASRNLGSFFFLSPSLPNSFSHMILLVPVRKLPWSFQQNLLHLSLQKKSPRHAVWSFIRPPYVSCMHGSSDRWPLRLRIHDAGVSTNVSRCLTNALHLDIQPIPGPHSYRHRPCVLVFIVPDTTLCCSHVSLNWNSLWRFTWVNCLSHSHQGAVERMIEHYGVCLCFFVRVYVI